MITKKIYEKTFKLWAKLIRQGKTDTIDFQNAEAFLHICMDNYERANPSLCNASQLHTKPAHLITEYHNNFVDRFIKVSE